MQRVEMKLNTELRGEEEQTEVSRDRRQTPDYLLVPRIRANRGDGSRSSPSTTMRHPVAPILDKRSRSEGNLLGSQQFDLRSGQPLEARNKRRVRLPRLHKEMSSDYHKGRNLKLTPEKPEFLSENNNNSMKVKRFAAPRFDEHKRLLKQHIEKEDNEYRAEQRKREHVFKWLSDQKA